MRGYSKETERAISGASQDKEQTQGLRKQQRKKRAANGGATSKMMSFRLDDENVKFLRDVPNKGRLINELLKRYFAK